MKKGTRICAAGLLALTMALGAAPALGVVSPATALAETVVVDGVTVDEQTVVIKRASGAIDDPAAVKKGDSIDNYIQSAKAGDTIYIGEGTYSLSNCWVKSAGVTIKGAGIGSTVITGTLNVSGLPTSAQAYTVSVSNLTMAAAASGQNGINVNNAEMTVNVSDVEFKGYEHAVIVNSGANYHTVVNMDAAKLSNVFVVFAVADGTDAKVNASYTGDSTYIWAAQGWGKTLDDGSARNGLYSSLDAYATDADKTNNNWNTDDKVQDNYNVNWTADDGYKCVATNGEYKYTDLRRALDIAKPNDTVSVQADCTLYDQAWVYSSYVTLEGNDHVITVEGDGLVNVVADGFTAQNVTVNGIKGNADPLFAVNGTGAAPNNVYFENVTLDNRGGKYAIDADHANVNISGEFDIVTGVEAEAGIVVRNTGTRLLSSVSFAADAVVSHNDQSGKNLPLIRVYAYDDNGTLPSVNVASGRLDVTTTDKDLDSDGKVDYRDYYVETLESDPNAPVTMWRMYNPYSGEHLLTTDASEVASLLGVGWRQDDVTMTFPATSETPVYRLYNPYTAEHHYTTDKNEYDQLVSIGWSGEGVKFYSAESGVAVARLYNPYEESYNHVFTTDSNEVATLLDLGWQLEDSDAFFALR